MILLCESLTKEPDGGSAAIPVMDFIEMYRFLARTDASEDVKYLNGYREGGVSFLHLAFLFKLRIRLICNIPKEEKKNSTLYNIKIKLIKCFRKIDYYIHVCLCNYNE